MDDNNFKKYNILHNEVMKRLDEGEITIEQVKELNNRFFDKYININNYENYFNEVTNQLYELSIQENGEPLIDKNIFTVNDYIIETFYGGNKYLDQIDSYFESLKSKIQRNPNDSDEITQIKKLLSELFGFEQVHFTVIPSKTMNACTIPFCWELKKPERKDFEIEKTPNGLRYKNPQGKSLYVYMNSYTIEMCTPRECTAILLHEIGHNFYAVEDYYKYARSNIINRSIIQVFYFLVLGIYTRNIALILLGVKSIIEIFAFCKSPQKYQDRILKLRTSNYDAKTKDYGFIKKSLIVILNAITGIIGVAFSPFTLLLTLPAVYVQKICNKFTSNVDNHEYLGEKFSDDFTASYGYAKEVANVFKNGRKLSYSGSLTQNIPILNMINSYNDAVYNSTLFLTDPHPERHQRCVNMLNKLKYELNNNSDKLTVQQKQQITTDIIQLEKIIEISKSNKHPITELIQDKLGLVKDKDMLSSKNITDEVLFDFEEKIFGDKH